jgi:hypothetical protein
VYRSNALPIKTNAVTSKIVIQVYLNSLVEGYLAFITQHSTTRRGRAFWHVKM